MSVLATFYPTTEYLSCTLALGGVNGFVIALCFFLLIATLALTIGTRRLNRKTAKR